MVGPQGVQHWSRGEFRVVDAPNKLAFTFAWEDEGALDTLVTIDFADQDGKTLMTFHQTPFADAESRDGHAGGWTESFDDIAAYVAGPL